MAHDDYVRAPVAWPGLVAVSAAFALLLVLTSGGYGYHRDELYFIAIGGEPAWGYVDQPPLVPLLAAALDSVFDGSLVALRLPSALAGGLIALITGLIAREFGARRGGQLFAAACAAGSAIVMAVSHLLSTSTFDLLIWTVLSWLLVRALRDGGRSWLAVGLIAGIGLQTKTLVVFLLIAVTAGLAVVGARDVFRSRWPYAAAVIAAMLWAPNLWWQAAHGWPQLELSRAIAAGSSGTSEPRWLFLPYQLVLVSPLLVPVWAAGLVRLARDQSLARWRPFAVAYPLLAMAFIATGGKPYYLCGLYPVLLAAGADPVLRWAARGAGRVRQGLLVAAVALSVAIGSVLFLPLVPADDVADTPITDVNYDAGETIGWPRFADTVSAVYDDLPPAEQSATVVLTRNYGQAGAVERFAPGIPVYSGHNSFHALGPPPKDTTGAVVVGYDRGHLERWFESVRQVGRVDNGVGLDNDEQGAVVWMCRGPRESWDGLWPQLRMLG